MDSVKEHYQNLLAKHYTWMYATPFENKVAEQKTLLEDALKSSRPIPDRGQAVDLGSGPGYQSLALAQLGYSPVLAIDTSALLLNELQTHRANLPIQTIEDDISELEKFVAPLSAQVIVCMGDTITHLDSKSSVIGLLNSISQSLMPNGTFILTYRDLSDELRGLGRFIPVHSDEDRVMTCFLEFDQQESVLVHDLIYSREDSRWKLEKSSYRKLRLPVDWLENEMLKVGLRVSRGQAGRLIQLVGHKP